VYKKEGISDPKYVLDVSQFQSLQRHDEANIIVITLKQDNIRIPLLFDKSREVYDWHFAFLWNMCRCRGMALPRFISRIVPKKELWEAGAVVTTQQLLAGYRFRSSVQGPPGSAKADKASTKKDDLPPPLLVSTMPAGSVGTTPKSH
jgi:hypothetical protein